MNKDSPQRPRAVLAELIEKVKDWEEDSHVTARRINELLPNLVTSVNNEPRLPWVSTLSLADLEVSSVPSTFVTGNALNMAGHSFANLNFTGKQVRGDLLRNRLAIVKAKDERGSMMGDFTFWNKEAGEVGVASIEFDYQGTISDVMYARLYQDGEPLGNASGVLKRNSNLYCQSFLTTFMLNTGDDREPASGTRCTVIDGIKVYEHKELFSSKTGYMESQTKIPPRKLPQVRTDLAKEFKHIGPKSSFELTKENKDYFTEIGTSLEESTEMWWVSEDMSKLAWDVTLSGTGPEDLSDRDLPSSAGIMWLNGGGGPVLMVKKQPQQDFPDTADTEKELLSVNAIIWYTPTEAYIPGLTVGVTRYMGLTASPSLTHDTNQWKGLLSLIDLESNEIEFHRVPTYVTYYNLKELPRQLALVAMRLAREETIGETTMETTGGAKEVGQATTRSSKKKRNRPISTVTCASLRKNRYGSEVERETEAREFSHRWIVRGHMRNQPYGPRKAEGGQKHERVWIAPYVKGPEDKPLVLKDRVQLFR